MCFLRWMSLQSRKLAVLDLVAFKDYHLQDGKIIKILVMITELNLTIEPISTDIQFYLFIHKN